MHEYGDSLRFKAEAWSHDQSIKSNPGLMGGSKYIGECDSLGITIHLPI